MLGQNIKDLVESDGLEGTVYKLSEALQNKELRPEEFSVRELAEAFCGNRWVSQLNENNMRRWGGVTLMEAGGEGVDVTAFSNITGQLIFSKIHEGWDQAAFIGDQLFVNVPTKLDGEKIPGIQRLAGEGEVVHPGQPFPETGLGEDYRTTPSTTKHGEIVSLTKEVIFFDRTGLLLQRAADVGQRVRMRKEKKQLAVVAGITVTIGNESFNGNNHNWRGTAYNTYATTTNAIGINSKSATPLQDWRDIEQAEQLFVDLLDPDTGNPILIVPTTLIVQPRKLRTAKRIVKATEVRHNANPVPGTTDVQTIGGNPMDADYTVLSSPILYQLIIASGVSATNAQEWWFLGDPKKCCWWMENWPLTVVQAPENAEKSFSQDIVMRWKASERGIPFMADPRYMVKMLNA